MTAHDLGTFLKEVGGKTCIINRSLNSGNKICYAVVGFESEDAMESAYYTKLIFNSVKLSWARLDLVHYENCGFLGHSALESAAFGGKSWVQVVLLASPSGDFYFNFSSRSDPPSSGSSDIKKNMPVVQNEFSINNCLASLKHSLELLADQMSSIMCRLNVVSLTTSVSTLASPDTNIVLDVPWPSLLFSSLVLEDKVADLGLSSLKIFISKVGSLESKMMAFEVSIGLILGKGMTNLAKQKDIVCWHKDSRNMISIVTETKLRSNIRPWIMNKFDELQVFTSGLDVGFCDTEVYVSKVDEVPGHLISVCLLFKNKLSVTILGLQAANINSMVSKMVNSSFFVVLGGDFNENESSKSVKKVIDFILVSENLASAMALYFVNGMSEFFDTDHKSWKFKLKDADNFLARSDMFEEAEVNGNLNTMWKILEEAIVQAADTVFFRIWYSEYNCLRNKQSSKFFKLELLVTKVVKYRNSGDFLNFNHLIKVWLAVDTVEASKVNNMVLNSISLVKLIKHLSVVKKGYHKFKYYKFKVAENTAIRKAIDCHIENFCSDKGKIIKSILKHPFYKIVLDYLVVDNKLVIESNEVKLKIDKIMKR
ncbi:hypothetical protein G9A89_017102 [Geosiphon pyriformis]|nr:hypothetical protein G9A89_017102 [Geosiphon pyriformis]